ncbi:MAG: ATP-binding protein [Deltaproteobacteria bacterium]|nr:ATP-binding protein [Deltaproteobacteria bacterium]
MRLNKEYFDWKEFIGQVSEPFQVRAEAKNVALDCSASSQPGTICGDRSVLGRVLANLLDNALRHTPRGGSISVHSVRNQHNGSLEVRIQDTGSGIPGGNRAETLKSSSSSAATPVPNPAPYPAGPDLLQNGR